MSRGARHPVDDFLFEYYPTRAAQLRRWHPGLGTALAGAHEFENDPSYRPLVIEGREVITVDPLHFARRRDGLAWVEGLLRRTAERPARLGCFGLHEWAMVYGLEQSEVRHEVWPLRLEPQEIRAVVNEHGLRCTHYDAFRFFTPEAAPMNERPLTRASQHDLDQSGCLHATMDLYKWSAKFVALVGSDLVADAFSLAREVRQLDMEAAPYDLSALGYRTVAIETSDGRAEYVGRQRDFSERGAPLRHRLLASLGSALAQIDQLEGRNQSSPNPPMSVGRADQLRRGPRPDTLSP